MKIVFMGTPAFSVNVLEALNKKYEVCLVVTQSDKYVGRKKVLTFSPVKQKAIDLNIEVFQPEKLKNDYQKIIDTKADILITAAYGQFVPTKVLNSFKKCINVHASLLPKRRGGAPIQRSIIEGDKETGVTIMEMVKGMDKGRIYAQKSIEILDSDNNTSLFNKLSIIGTSLLLENILDIYNGVNKGVLQDESLATISPNISSEEEKFNFSSKARDVFNKIRGLSEEPGAYFLYKNLRIKVYESLIIKNTDDIKPGTIIDSKKHLIIKCREDSIEILRIKVQGKKEMKTKDYLNGQKIFKIGEIIE